MRGRRATHSHEALDDSASCKTSELDDICFHAAGCSEDYCYQELLSNRLSWHGKNLCAASRTVAGSHRIFMQHPELTSVLIDFSLSF